MVNSFVAAETLASLLLAEQVTEPVLKQLDQPRRAAVVMALLALALTGLFLVLCAMLGGHWVRRLARHRPGKHDRTSDEAALQNQRLRAALESVLPESKTDDTIQHGRSPAETKVDRR